MGEGLNTIRSPRRAACVILQDEIVPCLKARQHPVDLLVGDLLIAAAEEQDAVLPGGVHLNDGVAAGAVAYGQKGGVHPTLPQDIRQDGAVPADLSGVADSSPGPCSGDGLVQPLAAAVDGAAGGAQGLPRLNEVGDLIHEIQIQRSITENVRHTPSLRRLFSVAQCLPQQRPAQGQHRQQQEEDADGPGEEDGGAALTQPFNQVMAMVALRAQSDKIILGGMGMTNDDYLFFKNTFSNAGALDRIVSFINTTEDPSVERILIPDMALCAAEYFAVQKNEKVLVLLTDMTNYADALAIVSNRMDQIPSKDSMPGSLYSDLAKIYEKAVQFPAGGSITIIAVTTLSGGDITHAVPDNTGYITEGQLYLRKDSDVGKVIVDPFRSLSRLKQLVTGKKTREDHPQVMNAAVRLYADAANAKTKMENGFDLTDYDNRTLAFAKDYSEKLLAIDVNLDTTEMLDVAWDLFGEYFEPAEVNIKQALVDKYWKK